MKDIGETTDVKAKHPDIVKQLQASRGEDAHELGDNGRQELASALRSVVNR